ncbi:hypothetical protein [Ralstonia wenshanensis]|uniref:hypothetical protein n=1 Tax=Ralstonia wenshanensis TaxID=2842456 RepID=UPI00292FAEB9|nr:hypothetical protein [Ralstonia wenshanensis]
MMYVTHSPATASAQCSCTVAMSRWAWSEAAALPSAHRATAHSSSAPRSPCGMACVSADHAAPAQMATSATMSMAVSTSF